MTELTIEEATRAIEELKDVIYWRKLVDFIHQHYPLEAVNFKLHFGSEYDDTNYYTIIEGISVYDVHGKKLYPRRDLLAEAIEEYDPNAPDEDYDWDDLEEGYIHDLLYEAGFRNSEQHIPLKHDYLMTEPPKTRFTKLFGE